MVGLGSSVKVFPGEVQGFLPDRKSNPDKTVEDAFLADELSSPEQGLKDGVTGSTEVGVSSVLHLVDRNNDHAAKKAMTLGPGLGRARSCVGEEFNVLTEVLTSRSFLDCSSDLLSKSPLFIGHIRPSLIAARLSRLFRKLLTQEKRHSEEMPAGNLASW